MEPHPYRQAFAAQDLDRLVPLLAEDVIVHSLFITEPAFEGRASAAALLAIAADVFKDSQYTHDLGNERSHVLVANAPVLGKPVNITWLLEFDGDGKIREIWPMARPLTGVVAVAEALARASADLGFPLDAPMSELAELAETFERAGARVVSDVNRATKTTASSPS